jgi:hypothetical protein
VLRLPDENHNSGALHGAPEVGALTRRFANEQLEYDIQTKVSRAGARGVRHGRFNAYSG